MLNCSSTIFSMIFDATGKSDSGRLFDACSWSPFLRIRMSSASFHALGKVLVTEQLMISVRGPRTTGRQSLIMRGLTLSGPGDLFDGKDVFLPFTPTKD